FLLHRLIRFKSLTVANNKQSIRSAIHSIEPIPMSTPIKFRSGKLSRSLSVQKGDHGTRFATNGIKHSDHPMRKIASDFSPSGSKNQTARSRCSFSLSEKPIYESAKLPK
ncbi:MAG TPA: hypothetical protein VF452_16425, partial [Candidatus Binatia bacterium]